MPMDVTPGLTPMPGLAPAPTPITSSAHGATNRGLSAGANPGQPYGRFGPMFEDLHPCPTLNNDGLADLANVIVKIDDGAPIIETEPVDENNKIPAGYTYFGQFVDHDISFDPTPLSAGQSDQDALVDFRTPALDLDNVYGRGPADQPYMYELDGLRLRVGEARDATAAPINAKVGTKHDLLRLGVDGGPAILGDQRNDENKIVSQIHGAIIAFHNKVVMSDDIIDQFGGDRSTPESRFQAAASIVRWHYQYVVLNDFLQRICEPGMVDEVLNKGHTPRLQHYLKADAKYAYLPLEFSVAAYRLGHSMVRPSYSLNGVVLTRKDEPTAVPPIIGGEPSKERIPTFSRAQFSTQNLNGFPGTLPPLWGIDWSFFLDDVPPREGGTMVDVPAKDGQSATKKPVIIPQPSYRIDAQIVQPLGDLPEFFSKAAPAGLSPTVAGNLAFRNLKRGQLLHLPSGQAVAMALGTTPMPDDVVWGTGSRIPLPANADQASKDAFKTTDDKRKAFKAKWVDPAGAPLKGNAPLWYYILREGEYYGVSDPNQNGVSFGGQHLGPVGSRIVAETFVGLLWLDQSSFLHSVRGFQPLPSITGGKKLTLGRFITFALS